MSNKNDNTEALIWIVLFAVLVTASFFLAADKMGEIPKDHGNHDIVYKKNGVYFNYQ